MAARAHGAAPPALRRARRAPSTCRPSGTVAMSTPRRLVLRSTVAARQADREERLWGPSVKVARDAAGAWTGAAQGFAKKSGVAARRPAAGAQGSRGRGGVPLPREEDRRPRRRRKSLPAVIGALLRALAFPKRMSWDAWLDDGKGAFPFGRPIRWMVALLDGKVVPFVIHALVDGARGRADRRGRARHLRPSLPARGGKAGKALEGRAPSPTSTRRCAQGLRDPRSRGAGRADPRRSSPRSGVEAGGRRPRAGRGVAAPRRVPDDRVRRHPGRVPRPAGARCWRRCSSITRSTCPSSSGGQVTRFAALTDTDGSVGRAHRPGDGARGGGAAARRRVLLPRGLEAAARRSRRGPVGGDVPPRARQLPRQGRAHGAARRGTAGGVRSRTSGAAAAREAAQLAKADLTTLMVREFPELQGVMGALYLKAAGAPRAGRARRCAGTTTRSPWRRGPTPAHEFADVAIVARLRRRLRRGQDGHAGRLLRPRASCPPAAAIPSACAARDRARSAPCSTSGPRRRARRRPSLRTLIAAALDGYEGRLKKPRPRRRARPRRRSCSTACATCSSAAGSPPTRSKRCWPPASRTPSTIPQEALQRLRALHSVRLEATEDFDHLAVAFKRARNILAGQARGRRRPAPCWTRPRSASCTRRWAALPGVDGGYEARLRSLAGLRGPVDRFFDDVMVMAEDPKVRANRLGLLSAGPLALLSHRGHLEARRLGWLDTSTSSAAARRTATGT